MRRLISRSLIWSLGAVIAGCAAPDPAPMVPSQITATPNLSPYLQFELYAQNAGPSELPLRGQLQFMVGSAQFQVNRSDGSSMGRLHVQPESCRDDPSPECLRRFVINGRLQAMGANLSCAIPVRNDVNVGYAYQTLSGLCQSQYGRAYTIQMFAR